ncbi:MAG TPA: hypothetical protein VF125_07790 [Solirubrobacterales bacterium]
MRSGSRVGFCGTALVAATLALCACGGGSDGPAAHEMAPLRPPPQRAVVAHRIGPGRVEPGEQRLPARPCLRSGSKGTTTVPIFSEAGPCARVQPGERLRFVNATGIGPGHEGAVPVRVSIGNYQLRIEPRGSGLIPAPVESYLGRGAHGVRVAGAPGATILLLPPVCAVRPPVAPGEEPCFR